MNDEFDAACGAVVDVVKAAGLAGEAERTVLWCVQHLSPLYREFSQTYDVRTGSEITRMQQAILAPVPSEVKATLLQQWRELHERLGLPALDPKLEPKVRSRKKAA